MGCVPFPGVMAGLALAFLPHRTQPRHHRRHAPPSFTLGPAYCTPLRDLQIPFFFAHQPPCYFSFSFPYCLPHLLSFQHFPGPSTSACCSHMTPTNYRAILLHNATTSFLASSFKRPLARNTSSFSFGPEVHSVNILYSLNKWGEKKKTAEEYKKGLLGARLSESRGYFISLDISHFSYHGWSHYGLNFENLFLLFSKEVTLQSAGREARPAGASTAMPCEGWLFLTNFRTCLFLCLVWCQESRVVVGLGAGENNSFDPLCGCYERLLSLPCFSSSIVSKWRTPAKLQEMTREQGWGLASVCGYATQGVIPTRTNSFLLSHGGDRAQPLAGTCV